MTDKQLIINWINNLTLYEKDYDILNMLLNTNDRFFVRVMTEVAKGNLRLSDFETLFGGGLYDTNLEDRFKLSRKLEEDLDFILDANDAINTFDEKLNKSIYENLLVSGSNTDIVEEVIDDEIYDFFKNNPTSSMLYRIHKEKLLDQFNAGIIDKNFLNRYIGVPIIPINYKDIVLSEEDKRFGLQKGLSMEQVKKIKSLNNYYRVKGD